MIAPQICPRRVAPNLLTLAGFLLTVVNFLLLTVYDYHFVASTVGNKPAVPQIPRWVWMAAAINLFLAHTLGKERVEMSQLCCADCCRIRLSMD